jgi:dienelactone hydrolase
MQKCCVTGTLHEGTPGGTVQTISNSACYYILTLLNPHLSCQVPVYIAHPPSPSPYAILLFTDVLGFTFRNTRLVADAFASCGYLTVIPDLFRGAEITWPIATDFDLQAYMDSTMPRAGAVDPIIESTIAWLKSEMSVQRVGGVGYCFGGKYVCRWLKGGGVYAGFVAHPSFVEKEEVEGVRGALSIAAAGKFAFVS